MVPDSSRVVKRGSFSLCLSLQKRRALPMEKYFMPEQNCFSSAKQFILTLKEYIFTP